MTDATLKVEAVIVVAGVPDKNGLVFSEEAIAHFDGRTFSGYHVTLEHRVIGDRERACLVARGEPA